MIAYTIVSRAYLAHARVLARSFLQHNPDDEFWALLVDDVDHHVGGDEPFRVLRLDDLDLATAEVHRMAMLFGSRLIAAIKPWVFEHFLTGGARAVLYVDSDIVVYDSLAGLASAATDGVILAPHVLHPIPLDGKDPDETKILGVGTFNAGLFGAGPGHGGFIQFLQERLRRECYFDVTKMRVNEQRWLDFVPSLFPHQVVRDPGVDAAYWNLHERPLERREDRLLVGGHPLRCFHFSSFDPRMTGVAGRYEMGSDPRVSRQRDPLLDELCTDYSRRLFDAGFAEAQGTPFGYDFLADGTPVYDSLRALYTDALAGAEIGNGLLPPDPFDAAALGDFRQWAVEAYRRADRPVPHRLRDTPSSPAANRVAPSDAPTGGGPRRRRWLRRPGPPTPPPPSGPPPSGASPSDDAHLIHSGATDWLGALQVGSAGSRQSGNGGSGPDIRVTPADAGFFAFGPRAALSPGHYQLTAELFPAPWPPEVSPHDQAVVAEVFLEGYALGHGTATFGELANGPLTIEFDLPPDLLQASLLEGVELRLLSRGRLGAVLGAVLVEQTGPAAAGVGGSGRYDWLAVMAAGDAGRRAGVEVVALPDTAGVVIHGPFWRLPAGRYRAAIRLRPNARRPAIGSHPMTKDPVGTFSAIAGEVELASTPVTGDHIAGSTVVLPFEVQTADAVPSSRVGLRLQSDHGIEATVEMVTVTVD